MIDVFLGMLFGIAIRSGSPLSLNIAEPVWKQLAGMPVLTISDLSEADKDFIPGRYLSVKIIIKIYMYQYSIVYLYLSN